MIFNVKKAAFGAHSYTFTGSSEFKSNGLDFELLLTSSGTNTLTLDVGIPLADICLVAGGKTGSKGQQGGAPGGRGGEVLHGNSERGITLPPGTYTVTIGASDQDTVLTAPDGRTWTARSGYGSNTGKPAGDGVLAWGDPATLLRTGWKYGAGGGYGSVLDYQYSELAGSAGGSVGAASSATTNGKGGVSGHVQGYPGLAGTGQAGGGGRREWNGSSYDDNNGGAGGSGAILIRNHKEANA